MVKLFQKLAQVKDVKSLSRSAERETPAESLRVAHTFTQNGEIPFAKKKNEAKNWELYPLGATPDFWLGFSAKS